MKTSVIISAAIIGLAISPAIAADLPTKAPLAPPPAPSWTGCYVGIVGGGNWGESNAKNDGTDAGPGSPLSPINITGNYRVSGGNFGGTFGCNLLQSGNWVFGLEGDFSWTNKHGSGNDLPPYNTATVNTTREEWIDTDRVRIGYAVTNNWLLYATGGLALAEMKYSITNPAVIVGGTVSETHTVAGWTVGAGVEWAVSSVWSVKAEYLYANFGNTQFFNFSSLIPVLPGAGAVANRNGGVFLDDNIVRVGVNAKFN